MKKIILFIVVVIGLTLTWYFFRIDHSQTDPNWLTYHNSKFNYNLDYPEQLVLREFPDTNDGADFYLTEDEDTNACITVSARDSVNKDHFSFDEYVKIAAIEEIQGFEKLNSIEEITTINGIRGYKTTWIYRVLAQEKQVSLPITYFSALNLVQEDDDIDYNYTIQINLNDLKCEDLYNQMILTFN